VYGCPNEKFGAFSTGAVDPTRFMSNHTMEVLGGVLSDQCAGVMQEFFRAKRVAKKALTDAARIIRPKPMPAIIEYGQRPCPCTQQGPSGG
jgi:hypothetical protein